MDLKKPVDKLKDFGSGAVGLSVGVVAMKGLNKVLPESTPELVKKVAPGIAGMALAYILMVKAGKENEYLQKGFLGIGLAGFSDVVKNLLGDKVSFIADNVPSLRGVPGYAAVNTGDYPPNYYKENAFQGLRGLQGGVPMNGDAFSLSGGVPMNGNAYALNGNGYVLN